MSGSGGSARFIAFALASLARAGPAVYYARAGLQRKKFESEETKELERVSRPELREPVLALIDKVSGAHASGQFVMMLAELFAAFGLTLAETEVAKLQARGDVSFSPRSDSEGEFLNQGDKVQLETDLGLILIVPETLAGTYVTGESSLTLRFTEGQALRGCKRIFMLICQDVIQIVADEHQLYIDLPGDKYDICFVF